MVTELGKLGIKAGELPDGIWVEGVDPHYISHLRPATIECHNDHRIAMSFAVLGARLPGITIGDKACVGAHEMRSRRDLGVISLSG